MYCHCRYHQTPPEAGHRTTVRFKRAAASDSVLYKVPIFHMCRPLVIENVEKQIHSMLHNLCVVCTKHDPNMRHPLLVPDSAVPNFHGEAAMMLACETDGTLMSAWK
jgi:hypothetical protein